MVEQTTTADSSSIINKTFIGGEPIKENRPVIQPLNEVIKALKICDNDHYVCTDCAYHSGNRCSKRMGIDAIYYLEILDCILHNMKGYIEIVGGLNQ